MSRRRELEVENYNKKVYQICGGKSGEKDKCDTARQLAFLTILLILLAI